MRFKELFTESADRSVTGSEELLSLSGKFGVIPRRRLTDKVERASTLIGYKIVRKGDLVVNKMQAHNGMAAISGFDGLVSPDYSVYVAKNSKVGKFIEFCMRSERYKEMIRGLSKGATEGFNRLNSKGFYTLPVVDFSHERMYLIAHSVESKVLVVNENIKALTQKLHLLEEYKTALIHDAVTKGLDANGRRILDGTPAEEMTWKDSGVEWIGEVPEGVVVTNSKPFMFSRKQNNKEMQRSNVLSLTLDGVITKDISSTGGLLPSDYSTYQFFNKGDLVFKLIDLENEKTSRVGLVHEDGIMSPAYIRMIPSGGISVRYIYYWFYSLYRKMVFNGLAGNGVRNAIGKEDLIRLPFLERSIVESEEIASYIESKVIVIDNIKKVINKKINLLLEYKKSLINEAVSGEMPVAESQAESVQ